METPIQNDRVGGNQLHEVNNIAISCTAICTHSGDSFVCFSIVKAVVGVFLRVVREQSEELNFSYHTSSGD